MGLIYLVLSEELMLVVSYARASYVILVGFVFGFKTNDYHFILGRIIYFDSDAIITEGCHATYNFYTNDTYSFRSSSVGLLHT